MKNKDFRRLTPYEKEALPAFLIGSIDVEKIQIIPNKWTVLTPSSITVARGYRIYWPSAPHEARDMFQLAHLVHEVVHIWQYNALGVGLYSPRWLDRRYSYQLHFGDNFFSFGLEQQASIIEDAFLVANNYLPRHIQNRPDPQVYSDILQALAQRFTN